MSEQLYFAPGRVNLIGEHLDYNGGKVLPIAISQGLKAKVVFSGNSVIKIRSEDFTGELVVDLQTENFSKRDVQWMNYPLGMIQYLLPYINPEHCGFSAFITSDLPAGSGLSSSAAIEVLIANILLKLDQTQSKADGKFVAQLCKKVENEYIGVNSGIMDQFVVAMGKAEHALLLDCDDLSHQYIPFLPKSHTLLVMNTNKSRNLTDSKYNERKEECELALIEINRHRNNHPISNLSQADFKWLGYIKDGLLQKRAKHVITENYRVHAAVNEIQNGDWFNFGELLFQSHISLKNNYEVSGFELDTLVDLSKQSPGCIGARMTGAGFGGCAIALVDSNMVWQFIEKVKPAYDKATGLSLQIIPTQAENGVHLIE
ncbi:MAG: galactokinase [Sphingobacteriales bacterium]|nr:MAG: galactokinase [Sphingobacteriales bacterium]